MRRSTCPLGLSCITLVLFAGPLRAAEPETPQPSEGKNCLFAGHSFFAPVARAFDEHAKKNGLAKHKQATVFSGGATGSPGKLWENESKRAEILKSLETGEVELFGLTYHPVGSFIDDYKRWIDTALKHNPKTEIFIGISWATQAKAREAAEYHEACVKGAEGVNEQIVAKLREAYPETQIHLLHYGIAACELKTRFDSGKLAEDFPANADARNNHLFRDELGHATPMLLDLAALLWLEELYQADLSKLELARSYKADLKAIAGPLMEYNAKFAAAEKQ